MTIQPALDTVRPAELPWRCWPTSIGRDGLWGADAKRIVRTVGAELTWDNEAFLPFGVDDLTVVECNRKLAGGGSAAGGRSTTFWIECEGRVR